MTTIERLARWKDAGVITPAQHDAIAAIVRGDRFSVFLELNALLYLGVLAVAGGVGWTVQAHFARLGDVVVLGTLGALLVACSGYVVSRAPAFSREEVESPTAVFDYVLYLGCLTFSVTLGYIEFRFGVLREAWDHHLLVAAACFFVLAYRFDNRLVLSLGLSTLAAWFGLRLRWWGLLSAEALRGSALLYGVVVATAGLVGAARGVKRHFLATYLHVAANVVFAALVSGVTAARGGPAYLGALLVLAVVVGVLAVRSGRFAFVVHAVGYAWVGVSVRVLREVTGVTLVLGYLLVSGAAVVGGTIALARRAGRMA